jgi:hypothetical protein
MKKYKLVKEQQESPNGFKLNDYVLSDPFHQPLSIFKVEGYPEFWELVESNLSRADTITARKISNLNVKEESNYLITAFRCTTTGIVYKIREDGLFYRYGIIIGDPLLDRTIKIYSVKNSKGEEFTVGEYYRVEYTKLDKISKFDVIDNKIIAYTGLLYCDIELLMYLRCPILTTHDGIEFYKGDEVYGVAIQASGNDMLIKEKLTFDFRDRSNRIWFYSKEKAQEYIDWNKPKYSLKDIENVMDKFEMFHHSDYSFVMNAIKALGK